MVYKNQNQNTLKPKKADTTFIWAMVMCKMTYVKKKSHLNEEGRKNKRFCSIAFFI